MTQVDGPQGATMDDPPRTVSFRDPSGRLVVLDDRVVRQVHKDGLDDLRAYTESRTIQQAADQGHAVSTKTLTHDEVEGTREILDALGRKQVDPEDVFVEHPRIAFPSYPYEWPPEMLEQAARLTLRLQDGLLEEGRCLKDASAYNILFEGPRPVFIDALSVESRDPHDPTWAPEAQFSRMFLLPLLVARDLSLPLSTTLLAHRDGLEPAQVHALTPRLRRLRAPYRWLVTLPTWLSGKAEKKEGELYKNRTMNDPRQARFVLRSSVRRLRRQLDQVTRTRARASNWSQYMQERSHYDERDAALKDRFVQEALEKTRPEWVLDIGSNTGHYSAMAAEAGARVVAIDQDSKSVDRLWHRAHEQGLDILPLVVDLSRPTPATGWDNAECPSFLQRAQGRFDLVLLLAVVHHLSISQRVPVPHILKTAGALSRQHVLVEHVGPEDPMFRRLLRGRDALHEHQDREHFETHLEPGFHVVASQALSGTDRTLYLLEKRGNERPDERVEESVQQPVKEAVQEPMQEPTQRPGQDAVPASRPRR